MRDAPPSHASGGKATLLRAPRAVHHQYMVSFAEAGLPNHFFVGSEKSATPTTASIDTLQSVLVKMTSSRRDEISAPVGDETPTCMRVPKGRSAASYQCRNERYEQKHFGYSRHHFIFSFLFGSECHSQLLANV